MAKSRTNRRFRKKSRKSSRKSSRTRKYKGGMKITGMAFLGLLASCTYLVHASFYKLFKAAAAAQAAIKVNQVIRDRVQRERTPAAPVAASTGDDGGIIIGTVEQLQQLQSPPGQPTFAPELLVAVTCDKTEFTAAVRKLEIASDVIEISNENKPELDKTLKNFE